MCWLQSVPHLRGFHYRGSHYRNIWLMYVQLGDFRISKGPPTVPLMRILYNTVFFKSQTSHKRNPPPDWIFWSFWKLIPLAQFYWSRFLNNIFQNRSKWWWRGGGGSGGSIPSIRRSRRHHHDFQKFLPNWYPHRPQLLIKATTAALNAFCDLLLHLRLQLTTLLRGTLGTPSHVHTGPRLLNSVQKYVIIKFLLIKSWGGVFLWNIILDLSWFTWLKDVKFMS